MPKVKSKKPIVGQNINKKTANCIKSSSKKARSHFHLPPVRKSNQKLIPLNSNKNVHIRIGQSKSETQWLNSIEPLFASRIEREKVVLGMPTIGNKREIFVLDGYLAKNNIAFEFLGSFYHADRRLYNHAEYSKFFKCTYGQVYLKTVRRFQTLSLLGYKIFYIWEVDWKKGSKGKFWKPGDPV